MNKSRAVYDLLCNTTELQGGKTRGKSYRAKAIKTAACFNRVQIRATDNYGNVYRATYDFKGAENK